MQISPAVQTVYLVSATLRWFSNIGSKFDHYWKFTDNLLALLVAKPGMLVDKTEQKDTKATLKCISRK